MTKPGAVDVSSSYKIDQAAVDRLTKAPAGPVGALVAATGRRVLDRARAATPVATGALRASEGVVDGVDANGEPVAGIVVGVAYWHIVEFGSRHVGPRPFLRPALGQVTV